MRGAPHLEPWRGHYLTRKIETEILADKFIFDENYVGLELGCGNAFQSALLASLTKRIFATDLFSEQRGTHTLGINRARDLINKLEIKNVSLVSCSASALPFADNYFDFVFSSSVLEHINNRNLALSEMRRVLKPGGDLILIVPAHMPSIYAFLHEVIYFLARGLKIIFDSNHKSMKGINNKGDLSASPLKRFRDNHPSFPMPEPHGDYPSVFHEYLQQLPSAWSSLLAKNGFKIRQSFGTCILPWSLIEPLSTSFLAKQYARLKKFHSRYGHFRVFRNCSYLICFLVRKV